MASSGGITCHVQRNLALLKELPRVSTANIKNFKGAKKKKQMKGRGPGSGRGKTSGRGHKGQGQRNTLPYLGFEGGQFPFYLSVPKHGRTNPNAKKFSRLNLERIQYLVDCGRLKEGEKLTIKRLLEIGAISRVQDGLKLLGGGADWFQAKIDIEVSLASKEAIKAVERQGGKITLVYHTTESLRAHVRPEDYPDQIRPKAVLPIDNWRYFYSNPKNRGYLADPDLVASERAKNRALENINESLKGLSLKESDPQEDSGPKEC